MSRGPKAALIRRDDASSLDANVLDPRTTVTRPERLTFRLDDLAELFGVSRRTLERERSAGRFPAPDLTIGKMPLWKPETIQRWVDSGGKGMT
jgi:hypothetical protein